ncbi:uncharacterized protein LOC142567942 [Dermacentor variabilis]|uniref:uncharacterized protein LOC142567942 n=1 Tax=Dermacentor variabilis TaxID=34621 RepID=UPI003F5BF02A
MLAALGGFFVILRVSVVNAQVCSPRHVIAKALEDAPNAQKLMQETKMTTFFLLYHSWDNTFGSKYPCLRVAKAPFSKISNVPMYVYGYRHKNQLRSSFKPVQVNKTDEAYRHHNEFIVDILIGRKAHREVFQVIYTDYKHCIVLWTSKLGYQVWVDSKYLKTNREAPSLCSFIYELLAPGERHVVYMWKKCIL